MLHHIETELVEAQRLARIGSWYWDARSNVIKGSDELYRIFGLDPGAPYLPPYREQRGRWYPVHDWERLRTAMQKTKQTGASYELDLQALCNGAPIWVSARGAAVLNSRHEFVGLRGTFQEITERKLAELTLVERNTQMDLAASAARIGWYSNDLGIGLITVSEGYAAIHGLPRGTVHTTLGEWRTRVHPHDLMPFDELCERLFRSRQREFTFAYRLIGGDGGTRWIESRGCISYGEDGTPQRCIGINIDVTERNQIEEALKESEAALRERLEALPAAIFVTDTEGRVTYCNQAAANLWGRMPKFGEDKWFDLARLYHSDGTPIATEDRPTEMALKGNRMVRSHEAILERADGTRIPVIPYPSTLRNAAGVVVGTLNMTVDISDRKNAELALAERNMQFALAEKSALVGSYSYDLDTKVVRVSEGYAALHGLPERTPITTGDQWRAQTHPEDLVRVEKMWAQSFRDRRSEYAMEYRIVRDGKVRWIHSHSIISFGRNGRAKQVVGVNIDVTERKRAEERQRLLVAELDHRVKNALATVTAIATHTLDGSRSMEHFVASLHGRIRSMASSHELLSRRRWEGMPLLELVQGELAPYMRDDNTEIDGPEVLLRAEAGQSMAFVLHELTTNAAKYGALSKPEGRVSVRWHWSASGAARERLVIEWQETGTPAIKPNPPRSGYGTSVIRQLIPHELGGTADLAITPEGARCRMELPGRWIEPETRTRSGNHLDPPETKFAHASSQCTRTGEEGE